MFRPNTLFFAKIGRKNRVAVVFRSLVFSSKNWMLDFFQHFLARRVKHTHHKQQRRRRDRAGHRALSHDLCCEWERSLSLSLSLSSPTKQFSQRGKQSLKKAVISCDDTQQLQRLFFIYLPSTETFSPILVILLKIEIFCWFLAPRYRTTLWWLETGS